MATDITTTPQELSIYLVNTGGNSGGGWVPVEGLPTPSDGKVGDRAINTVTGDIYPPKKRSGWTYTPEGTLNLGAIQGNFSNILSRVPALEGLVNSLAQANGRMQDSIDGYGDIVIGQNASIEGFEMQLGGINGTLSGINLRLTDVEEEYDIVQLRLDNAFDDPENGLIAHSQAISALGIGVGPTGALAQSIQQLESDYNNLDTQINSTSGLVHQMNSFSGELNSYANILTQLDSEWRDNTTGFIAVANAVEQLEIKTGPSGSIANSLQSLTSQVGINTGNISQESSTRAQQIGVLGDQINSVDAGIQTKINSSLGPVNSSINVVANTAAGASTKAGQVDDYSRARYSIKLNASGVITGMDMKANNSSGGTGNKSEVVFTTDIFKIVSNTSGSNKKQPFVYSGNTLKLQNLEVEGAYIKDLTVDTIKIKDDAISNFIISNRASAPVGTFNQSNVVHSLTLPSPTGLYQISYGLSATNTWPSRTYSTYEIKVGSTVLATGKVGPLRWYGVKGEGGAITASASGVAIYKKTTSGTQSLQIIMTDGNAAHDLYFRTIFLKK